MTEQEVTQARADLDQIDIEQLRCGVMLQLLKIEALTKERDTLAADAARYRFITAHIVDEGDMNVLERAFESIGESDTCTQAEFDACIDAAIVKEARQAVVQ